MRARARRPQRPDQAPSKQKRTGFFAPAPAVDVTGTNTSSNSLCNAAEDNGQGRLGCARTSLAPPPPGLAGRLDPPSARPSGLQLSRGACACVHMPLPRCLPAESRSAAHLSAPPARRTIPLPARDHLPLPLRGLDQLQFGTAGRRRRTGPPWSHGLTPAM